MPISLVITAMVILIMSIIFDRYVDALIKQGRISPDKGAEVVRIVDLTTAVLSITLTALALILAK